MIGWLAGKIGISVWLLEIIIVAGAGAAIFWYIKHREAIAFDKGHASGIKENIEDQIKPLKADLENQKKAVAQDRQLVNKDKENVTAERKNLIQLRAGMEQEYSKQLKEILAREATTNAGIEHLTDAEVISSLRVQLIRNRAIIDAAGSINK